MLWIEQQACDLHSWLAPVSDLGGPAHQAQEWPGFRGVWQGRMCRLDSSTLAAHGELRMAE